MQHVERARRRLEQAAALKLLHGAVLLGCALAPLLRSPAPEHGAVAPSSAEAPASWAGEPLQPLPLTALEQRFAARFPGVLQRARAGDAVLVWRRVDQPTRMLHPAADCYRGAGYRVDQIAVRQPPGGAAWRCFSAERGSTRLQVCERIVDADSEAFTDTSSWYWAALLGRSRGPWQAWTVARDAGV